MTARDDLDDLAKAMRAATPVPDQGRRAEVLARARARFEAIQEGRAEPRPNSAAPKSRGLLGGILTMFAARATRATRTTGALTATTALVGAGFLFLSPAGQDLLRGPQTGQPPVVEVPLPDPAPAVAEDDAPRPRDIGAQEQEIAVGEPAIRDLPAPVPDQAPVPALAAPVPQRLETRPAAPAQAPSPALSGDAVAALSASPGETAPLGRLAPAPASGIAGIVAPPDAIVAPAPVTEAFAHADPNPVRLVTEDPVSTFSIDVDTASWSLLRSSLARGQLPAPEAVRIEEMLNYFPYDYPTPDAGDESPFRAAIEVFQTPWNPDTQLLRIGLQGVLPAIEDRPALNLVFLIDTSGSMNEPGKLPLLIQSFRLLLDRLRPGDEVAIVTYAGSAGVALEPTPAGDTATISAALSALQAGGSTNGAGGLQAAYDLAARMTEEGEVSRVLLATDGDFNVGISDPDALQDYIAGQRDSGIYLSVLGFGRGNLQDATMQALAQSGNGTAAYIDTLHEAQRVLVDQVAGALFPIADDLKVQVEFNPAVIAEYRLIGYETRALAREDFADDDVDAGELGAGHSVTALYEVTPTGSPARRIAPLRYAEVDAAPATATAFADELGFLSLRWKAPGEEASRLVEIAIPAAATAPGTEALFAAAIAGFGELLRGSGDLGDWGYAEAIALASANRGADEFGYRQEAVQLMRLAQSLSR